MLKKRWWIRLLCLIAALLAAAPPAAATPTRYAALGDSIASGYGVAEGEEYPALVAAALGADAVNLAESGLDSAGLLARLGTAAYRDALAGAGVVTVTIGANDVLGSFLDLVAEALGCTTAEIPERLRTLLSPGNAELFSALTSLASRIPAALEPGGTLAAGVDALAANLPAILAAVRIAAPAADIYVTTIYNPYSGFLVGAGQYAFDLGAVAEPAVSAANAAIAAAVTSGEAALVELSDAFSSPGEPRVNADPSVPSLDPHPNAAGHVVIAAAVLERIRLSAAAEATLTPTTPSPTATSAPPASPDASAEPDEESSMRPLYALLLIAAVAVPLIVAVGSFFVLRRRNRRR